jgi:ATP-dependent DNA helicase RecG
MILADTALAELPGIGPTRAAALHDLGLETAWDLLHAPPRCLGPPPPLCEQGEPERGTAVRLRAQLLTVARRFTRGRGLGLEATLERADGRRMRARFWRAAMLARLLVPGGWYLFEGAVDRTRADLLLHPSFAPLADGPGAALPPEPPIRVAYRLPAGISRRGYATLVAHALAHALPAIADPAGELDDASYQAALGALHRPASAADHEAARALFARRELLALAWQLQERRRAACARPGRAWRFDDEVARRLLAVLPFALTAGQRAALAELRADLGDPQPMYRLLHGEVGSGKTALALIASLAVIAGGGQALWLAPTAVLARQHADFCLRCLAAPAGRDLGVALGLLTGGTPAAERRELLAALRDRRLGLLIGTHALLDDQVELGELGLLVIDEQHKFGVDQRASLLARVAARQPYQPDLLLMTATPIPRTLALTCFGDLAVTRIADRPPGRAGVATELSAYQGLGQLDQPLRLALGDGGSCLVICAARQEGLTGRLVDVASAHRHLSARFAAAGVGLLHGALGEDDKLALMAAFAHGRSRVLVATSVVEVGIDVADANLLVVLDAERFGLAQLHQLRGRLGRGKRPGRCLLFHRSPVPPARLAILCASDDGLALAAHDLAERGAGELLGTAQHGAPLLRCADLVRDLASLEEAHGLARRLHGAGRRPDARLLRLVAGAPARGALLGG